MKNTTFLAASLLGIATLLAGCQTAPEKAVAPVGMGNQLGPKLARLLPGTYDDAVNAKMGRRREHFREISTIEFAEGDGDYFLVQDFFDSGHKRLVKAEVFNLKSSADGSIHQRLFAMAEGAGDKKEQISQGDLIEVTGCDMRWQYSDGIYAATTTGKLCPGVNPQRYAVRRIEVDDYGVKDQTTQHDRNTDQFVGHSVEEVLRREKAYLANISLAEIDDIKKWAHTNVRDILDNGQYMRVKNADESESVYAFQVSTVARGNREALQLRVRNVDSGEWLGSAWAPTGAKFLGWENDKVRIQLFRQAK